VTLLLEEPAAAEPLRRVRRRRLLLLAGLAVLLLVAVVLSLAVGARAVAPGAVWDALVTPTGSDDDVVVRSLRVPRTATAVVVGVALGTAGALAQGHTRNPLADPGLLGVSAGAALAVVVGITLGVSTPLPQAGLAVVGALVASLVVFALGGVGRRGSSPATLALAGVVLTALLLSLVSTVVLLDAAALDAYRFWTVGSVAGRGSDVLPAVLPLVAVGLVLALVNAPALDLLGLGNDVASGLGVAVRRTRLVGLAAVALLTAAATAVAGPIAFVGLVVPHLARAATGPAHRWLVPVSALVGAVLVLLADVVGRVVARPGELQVGLVLAVVGAPALVALVRSRRLVLT
jgi:iron complex transport system permease protein